MTNYSYTTDEQEKIRQQFDHDPYPHIPIEQSPKEQYNELFIHNLVTPYYLHYRQVINTQGKKILDVGCGSGYKSLVLAEANPGAQIVGVDISQESIDLAEKRLAHHGVTPCEFHCLSIEDLPELNQKFDYINCDEMLYLLPDPTAGLQAMKAVLKPQGLIRTNLHHAYQRAPFYRAQELFRLMGLMEQSVTEFEEDAVIETMQALKDGIKLKTQTWPGKQINEAKPGKRREWIGMNFLFQGDRGFTVPDVFTMLKKADLEFVNMVNWRHWKVEDLFKDPDNLPEFWQFSLAGASPQELLRVFELLHPVHRLIDFWCTQPGEPGVSVDDWSEADWQTATVHLHPQLRAEKIRQKLIECVQDHQPFEISAVIPMVVLAPVLLEPGLASCLLPLWDGPSPINILVDRYLKTHPLNIVTLEPIDYGQAFAAVKDLLNRLDAFLYVLLER
jgi:2-polyprenyl-3-methyl-5-hydroxy-6-metoxy-1,4-benzoquinol methylase